MTVYELSEDQLEELASRYLDEKNAERGKGTSWAELADPFSFVSRDEVIKEHECYDFGNDDFFCTAGREEE
jgi:hypothetical protein